MSLDGPTRKKLQKLAHELKPVAQIGKGGVSEAMLAELERHFKQNRLLKVKFLPAGQDDMDVDGLAAAVNAEVVETRGHTVVLYRQRK